jgi:thermitase
MRVRKFAVALTLTAIPIAAHANSLTKEPAHVPGEYVVTLRPSFDIYKSEEIERELGGKIVDRIRNNMFLVKRSDAESLEIALDALRRNELVEVADPNMIYHAFKTPNDPSFSQLWGMNNSGDLDTSGLRGLKTVDINAVKAWDITTGSKSVVVAVIDTGVDFAIPDLTANSWTNLTEANGVAGVDDDANGFVDDIHGYDFQNNKGDSTDDNGHGSHCSGTIGGQGDDAQGIVGVNWNTSIMAVKFLDADGSGTLANAVKAVDYARKMGAKIMSNSWGGGGANETLKKAIEDARDAGILFVAAAGNDSSNNDTTPSYPSSYDVANIISVAAVDNRGELADFSNFGNKTVHIAAPGVNIISTTLKGLESYSGTSMATPHVSGVAALLLANNPNLTAQELKDKILKGARPMKSLDGKVFSGGMLDAYLALTGDIPGIDPNDASTWVNTQPADVSTPHPYAMKYQNTYTLRVPGATRISARFLKFETEHGYDRVRFLNGAGESLGSWSGNQTGRLAPIADGETLTLQFSSDESVNGYGFDIDQVVFEK